MTLKNILHQLLFLLVIYNNSILCQNYKGIYAYNFNTEQIDYINGPFPYWINSYYNDETRNNNNIKSTLDIIKDIYERMHNNSALEIIQEMYEKMNENEDIINDENNNQEIDCSSCFDYCCDGNNGNNNFCDNCKRYYWYDCYQRKDCRCNCTFNVTVQCVSTTPEPLFSSFTLVDDLPVFPMCTYQLPSNPPITCSNNHIPMSQLVTLSNAGPFDESITIIPGVPGTVHIVKYIEYCIVFQNNGTSTSAGDVTLFIFENLPNSIAVIPITTYTNTLLSNTNATLNQFSISNYSTGKGTDIGYAFELCPTCFLVGNGNQFIVFYCQSPSS